MTLERDIERLAAQESVLQLSRFDRGDAWTLGSTIRDLALARGVAVAIEVRLGGETVFTHAMLGCTPSNGDWIRRKRNSVELLHQSSYAIGRGLEQQGQTLQDKMGLPVRDYASHGGSFPLRVRGVGVIGVVTASGLPQREDHAIVIEALALLCGVDTAGIALD